MYKVILSLITILFLNGCFFSNVENALRDQTETIKSAVGEHVESGLERVDKALHATGANTQGVQDLKKLTSSMTEKIEDNSKTLVGMLSIQKTLISTVDKMNDWMMYILITSLLGTISIVIQMIKGESNKK